MRTRDVLTTAALLCLPWIALPASAQGVIRVVVVEPDDVAEYVEQIEEGRAILDRLNIPATVRVLQAGYAGPNAGNVVVTVEYEDIVALAESEVRALSDEGYQAWLAGLDEIRTIVSDSIYRELSP